MAGSKTSAARRGQTIVFIDESGVSHRPTVLRTWAPRGQTPVIQYSFNWQQLSAIAGLSFWRFYFRFFPGTKQIWNYLKNREIANPCAANLAEVGDLARRRLRSMQRRPNLIRAFGRQTELAFRICHVFIRASLEGGCRSDRIWSPLPTST